jgi:hypothetical protein
MALSMKPLWSRPKTCSHQRRLWRPEEIGERREAHIREG